jgi:hypothetical protein
VRFDIKLNVSEKHIAAIFRVKESVSHKLVYRYNTCTFINRFPYFMSISDFTTRVRQKLRVTN